MGNKQRTTSAAWVGGIVSALTDAGLNGRALCAEVGIDPDALASAQARCATEQVSQLWRRAAERSCDPGIALVAARGVRPSKFEVVGYAMMSSDHLQAALERLVRYLRILSDAATMALADEGEASCIELELFGGMLPVPGQRYEFDLLALLNFCRWAAARELRPLRIEFSHAAAVEPARYAEAFQCPVHFGAARNGFTLARSDLMQPLPAANPVMAELHDRFAGEHIKRLAQDPTSAQSRELIVRRLPDGEPKREEIAKAMCISERTLQRRLLDEGTCFQQLLDDTRRELAERYLGQPSLSFVQAAYLLGFSDQGNFNRACKRWFAMTPGDYRRRNVP